MAPGRCPRTLCWSNRKGNRPTPKRPWVGLKPTTSSTNQILLEVNERRRSLGSHSWDIFSGPRPLLREYVNGFQLPRDLVGKWTGTFGPAFGRCPFRLRDGAPKTDDRREERNNNHQ